MATMSHAEEWLLLARVHAVLSGDPSVAPLTGRERAQLVERIGWACETMLAMTPEERQACSFRFRTHQGINDSTGYREVRAMNATDHSTQRLLLANQEACARVQAELAADTARIAAALRAPRWREPVIGVLLVAAGLALGLLAR